MRTEKCDYGIEDVINCSRCKSDCTFNDNPNPELTQHNVELLNEYKRLMNLYIDEIRKWGIK
jgi:hypothetical protein